MARLVPGAVVAIAALLAAAAATPSRDATPKPPAAAVCVPKTIRMEYFSSLGAKLGEYDARFDKIVRVYPDDPYSYKCLWYASAPGDEAFVVFIGITPPGLPGRIAAGNCDGTRPSNHPFYNSRKRYLGVSGGERKYFQNAVGGNARILKSVLAAAEAAGVGRLCPGTKPPPKPRPKPPGDEEKGGTLFIRYEMPQRFGLDRNDDGLVDYTNSPDTVDPRSWPVDFQLSGISCDRLDPRWRVNGSPAKFSRVGPCKYVHNFPREGKFRVQAVNGNRTGTIEVLVQDWLIVGVGDSVASGEGNADIRRNGEQPARWQSTRCHRSANSFQARVAKKIEVPDDRTSVTFLHLACSGAGIANGLIGPYEGIEGGEEKTKLPSQLSALKKVVGDREVDALLVNVGANDLEFGSVLKFCLKWVECHERVYKNGFLLRQWMQIGMKGLVEEYVRLADRISEVGVDQKHVFITEYPDELHGADGRICRSIIGVPAVLTITSSEAQWLYDDFLVDLDDLIRRVAPALKWTSVGGGLTTFAKRGYCAGNDRWVVTALDSKSRQGNFEGTMHPNESGHGNLAQLLLQPLKKAFYPNGKDPRAPR